MLVNIDISSSLAHSNCTSWICGNPAWAPHNLQLVLLAGALPWTFYMGNRFWLGGRDSDESKPLTPKFWFLIRFCPLLGNICKSKILVNIQFPSKITIFGGTAPEFLTVGCIPPSPSGDTHGCWLRRIRFFQLSLKGIGKFLGISNFYNNIYNQNRST